MLELNTSWDRAWRGIGEAADSQLVRNELIDCYSESHRSYHTVQHLKECIQAFERVRHLATHAAEVELALWFHDAVYDPTRSDNERLSADLAVSALQDAGMPAETTARVEQLVMATQHTASPNGVDEQLLIDVDLSILGSASDRFDDYEKQVRQEYAFVPEAVFWNKRCQIVQSFLDRERIYSSPFFYTSLEQRARANLQRSMDQACKITAMNTNATPDVAH